LASGQQYFPFGQYEVIVTDDGRDFNVEAFCKVNFPWVKYIQGPQKGPADNRNNGSKAAKHHWLVFLDDDCIPDKSLLHEYYLSISQNARSIKSFFMENRLSESISIESRVLVNKIYFFE